MPVPEPITVGEAAVRSWCGWHVAPRVSETVSLEGDGGRVLLLPSLLVADVTEIRGESGEVQSGYKWRPNGVLRGCWTNEELYEVDFVHGYVIMPIELQAIIDDIDAAGLGKSVKRQSAGPFLLEFGADLDAQPISVRSVIDRYKLPPRP